MLEANPALGEKPQVKIAGLIPAYNEAATIRELVDQIRPQVGLLVVVDDGSDDATAAQLEGLDIELIRLRQNQGKASALWQGIQALRQRGFSHVLTLDGDGQHDPSEVVSLKQQVRAEPDRIVIGARRKNAQSAPRARRAANHIADFWISWACGRRVHDSQSGFRIYPLALFEHWRPDLRPGQGFVFESAILIDAAERGYYTRAVPIATHYPEQARRSHFRPFGDISRIVLMVANRLLRRRMNLNGLWRVWLRPDPSFDDRWRS